MLQSLFPSKKHAITNVQNANAMCMIISTTCLYFMDSMDYCYSIIFIYLLVDLMFSQTESTIHHILILLMLTCKQAYGYSNNDVGIIVKPFIKTEMSTFFLTLKMIYENNVSKNTRETKIARIASNINDAIFVIAFTKTRMYDLLYDTLLSYKMYETIQPPLQDSIVRNVHFYTGFYGIYLLNLYWFIKILKKIYRDAVIKTSFAWINTQMFAEKVITLTMFLYVVPIMFYRVSLWNFVGTVSLSIVSYMYHNKKYSIFKSGENVLIINNNFSDSPNVVCVDSEFFFNAAAIHLKSNLSLISIGSDRGFTSMILHFICFVGSQFYSLSQIKIEQKSEWNKDDENNKHLNILDLCEIIPSLYDLFFIIESTNDRVVKTKIVLTVVALALVMKIKPLYNLNHIVVHILVIIQSWIVTQTIQ